MSPRLTFSHRALTLKAVRARAVQGVRGRFVTRLTAPTHLLLAGLIRAHLTSTFSLTSSSIPQESQSVISVSKQ